MRISDWSSDVCSSDLLLRDEGADVRVHPARDGQEDATVARDGGMIAQHPFEAGEVCRRGMGTLDDLRQLARVATSTMLRAQRPMATMLARDTCPASSTNSQSKACICWRRAKKKAVPPTTLDSASSGSSLVVVRVMPGQSAG